PSVFGITKPVKITATNPKATIDPITSKITYSAEVMAKRPKYSSNRVSGVSGVTYSWDEDIPFNGSNNLVEYNGTFYKPLTYVE
ncbi:hypothetical protein QJS79_15320, partial [Enterococcus faecium]